MPDSPLPLPLTDRLAAFLKLQYERLTERPVHLCQIRFFPYARLAHSIRLRNGLLEARLSDLLSEAPVEVLEAVLLKLAYRLSGRRTPRKWTQVYREFANRPDMVLREREARRLRGRKSILPPRGEVFDLGEIFGELNDGYFSGKVEVRQLGWSPGKSRSSLGHYDPAHGAIVVNRRLDNPLVPRYVVAYVVYHEMLHVVHGEQFRNGQRLVHHRAMRHADRAFEDYERARTFIRRHFQFR